MATHAHYMSELNNIFQGKWIIYDSNNSMFFMSIEYKVKSDYKISNKVCILYTGMPIIKNTRSCIITKNEHDNSNINIKITKPQFNNSFEMIDYNITAIKASSNVWYTVANNVRVVHPQYIIRNRTIDDSAFSFCSEIASKIYNLKHKLRNQMIFIEENKKKHLLTIELLETKFNKLTQQFILDNSIEQPEKTDEPSAKRNKHY